MILTTKQQEGLDIALQRHRDGEKFTVISGYAGTGKSTLVRFIIEALDVEEDKVCYCAFTGKAAEVLRKKGNKNSITLHKLLYDHIPKPAGGFYRKPKPQLDYTIVVVDEVSMAPKTLMDLLLSHQVYVICLGDPFQLPPIDKNEDNHLLDHPHIFLDEIMRQAAESEIIQLTMKVREGKDIPPMQGNEVIVIPRKELVTGHLTWADSIITATNATRHGINQQMRELLGYEGALCENEKIICKRNYWEDCNDDGDALVNGTIGKVENCFESFVRIPSYIKNNRHDLPTIMCNIKPDGGSEFIGVNIDKDFLLTEQPCVDWRVAYQVGRLRNKIGDILPRQITYGYSLTAWNAQGSEWDRVLVIEENFPFNKKEHQQFLYTAATRASEKLVLIRN